jgi:protein O-mannosyl-transferase
VTNYTSIKNIPKWPYLILIVLGFIYYGNSLKNGFSMDDDLVTSTPEFVHKNVEKGFSGIIPIFKSRYATNATQNYEYRPVTTASFAIQYALFADADLEAEARLKPKNQESIEYWQKQATISHFISVLLYIICCILVFILVYKIIPEYKLHVALLTAILFLIHPIHTEVVDNIKSRDELLVMFFGFGSLIILLKVMSGNLLPKKKIGFLTLGIVLLILSIFSKKSGFVFVALIPVVLYFFTNLTWKNIVPILILFFVSGLLFSLTKKMVFDEGSERELFFYENPLYIDGSWTMKIPMFFYTIMWYVKMIFWPNPLSFYYGYNELPMADFSYPLVWLGIVFVVGLTVVGLWRIRKKEIWFFGFLFFMFSIGGIANLIVVAPGIVAERFLYVPSFGLLLIVSYYAVKYFHKYQQKSTFKYASFTIGGLVIIGSFVHVTNRNPVWESQFSLYNNDIKHLNKSAKAHSLMATEYREVAMQNTQNFNTYLAYIDSSKYHFEKALEIYPAYSNCLNNLGVLYHVNMQKTWEAIPLFRKAIEVKKDYHQANHSLGTCYAKVIGATDFINNSLQFIKIDSSAKGSTNLTINQDVFISASYAKMIYDMVIKTLQTKGEAVYNTANHSAILKEIQNSINQFLVLENSYLKLSFNFSSELYEPLNKAFGMFTPESYQKTFEAIDKGIQYKFGVFYADLISKQLKLNSYEQADQLFYTINDQRKIYVDSAMIFYESAMKIDSLNPIYYDDFIAFLHKEKKEKEFVQANVNTINSAPLKNKIQYFLNLANYYIYKQDLENGLTYINQGIEHANKVKVDLQKNTELEKSVVLKDTKTIQDALKIFYQLGYQIHTAKGNTSEADKFVKLYESVK